MGKGNGAPEPIERRNTGAALARFTKFSPLIDPDLSVGARCEVAHKLIDQLCEQLHLGGSLKGWQIANALTAVAGKWERYPRDDRKLEELIKARFERDHVVPCGECRGTGAKRK